MSIKKLTGLWYEYLGTEGVKDGDTYDCASWLMMIDQANDTYLSVVYST
jgi:hypothetical protein